MRELLSRAFCTLLHCYYCLILQADVVPTSGGGAQIIFNDVETLKQRSPNATPVRKRNASTSELQDSEAACAVAVEGHKRMRH